MGKLAFRKNIRVATSSYLVTIVVWLFTVDSHLRTWK